MHEKNLELKGRKIGGYVKFKKGNRNISLRIGSSFISFKQAAENINKEIPVQKSFEAQKTETKERWNTLLNKIKIKSSNEDDKILFYSMLYRTLQYPRNISEMDIITVLLTIRCTKVLRTTLFQHGIPFDPCIHYCKYWSLNK